jgi:hypothetical protein
MCKATAISRVRRSTSQICDRGRLRAPLMGVNVRPLEPRARARRLDVAAPHSSDVAAKHARSSILRSTGSAARNRRGRGPDIDSVETIWGYRRFNPRSTALLASFDLSIYRTIAVAMNGSSVHAYGR